MSDAFPFIHRQSEREPGAIRRPAPAVGQPAPVKPAAKAVVAAAAKKPVVAQNSSKKSRDIYEACKKAYEDLASNYAALDADRRADAQRLVRLEHDLRTERARASEYAGQIARHEGDMRKLREAKAAVERLNTDLAKRAHPDLEHRLAVEAAWRVDFQRKLGEAEQKLAVEASKLATEASKRAEIEKKLSTEASKRAEVEKKLAAEAGKRAEVEKKLAVETGMRMELERKAASPEASQKIQACTKMLAHVDAVLGVCADNCGDPAVGTGIKETRETLRAFRSGL
jgi:chromosome segregation ATPase